VTELDQVIERNGFWYKDMNTKKEFEVSGLTLTRMSFFLFPA